MSWTEERDLALKAVTTAAQLCRRVQANLGAGQVSKADRSPVTVADFGSQALICELLEGSFPDDPVVGEEDSRTLREAEGGLLGRVHAEVEAIRGPVEVAQVCAWIDRGGTRQPRPRFWTLDPIDGTKGFLRGECYSVALALVIDGQPVVAAIACPSLNTLFHAVRGGGAWARPLDDPQAAPERIQVVQRPPGEARYAESVESGHSDQDQAARIAAQLGIEKPPVRLDSMAKYALVARGEADVYLRFPRSGYQEKVWDHAPGVLILQEAGGRVTDLAGHTPTFDAGPTFAVEGGLVASHGGWHDRILAAARAD